MLEIEGNFWDQIASAHVITTNGTPSHQAVMGRGIALQAKKKFPGIATYLGGRIRSQGNKVHFLGGWTTVEGRTYTLVALPVKHQWWEPADLDLIKTSIAQLVLELPPSFSKVVMVRPGCGNGQLKWEDVKPAIEPMLEDRFVVVNFRPTPFPVKGG